MLTALLLALFAAEPTAEDLLIPFGGFNREGMKPVEALFERDTQGRNLLQRARRKLKLRSTAELQDIYCYCTESQLGGNPNRRGLFIQETARYYRAIGEEDWKQESTDGLKKLNDPQTYPAIDRRESRNSVFEYMELAFMPKICIRRGMSILQTYLVLYHELTHLAGLDPFHDLDLMKIRADHLEDDYYIPALTVKGGEQDAFVAQMGAFKRLKERYDIPFQSALEPFLSQKGRLIYRQRDAFLEHLLYVADYQSLLDYNLAQEIVYQYNRAQSWWDYTDRYMAALDEQLEKIDQNLERLEDAAAQNNGRDAKRSEEISRLSEEMNSKRLENRRLWRRYQADQKSFIQAGEDI